MKLDEALEAFVHHRAICPVIGNYYSCATGEPYICIMSGGSKQEGDPRPGLYASMEEASQAWLDAAFDYARDKLGIIYWRWPPEMESGEVDGKTVYSVYS